MPFDSQQPSLKIKPAASSPLDCSVIGDHKETILPTYNAFGKRVLDLTLILLSAPIVIPVIAMMALLIYFGGQSPFYTQARIGRGGATFRIFKMRTMVDNADTILEEYLDRNPDAKREWDSTQKLKKDVRITAVGRVLRKTSLDELPQLINVLNGTMSLVGPRPMMVEQRAMYPGHAYYSLRPGITGFWQISDRNQCDFCDRAKYDAAYARSISLKTDIIVLFKTVRVVLRGTGY